MKRIKALILIEIIVCLMSFSQSSFAVNVYTPNGTSVPVTIRAEMSTTDYWIDYNWVVNNFPNAVILRMPTRKYNCHSYAWYSQSTSNLYWMDHPGDDSYWLDGSYYRSYFQATGNRISYVYGDHSGIVDTNNTFIVSKWGELCLVKHLYTYCPYNWSSVRYYVR